MPHEIPVETCHACAFDAARWTRQDAIRTMGHAADFVRALTSGMASELWNQRPDASTWSIAEYVDHLAEVCHMNRLGAELGVTQPECSLGGIEIPTFNEVPTEHDPDVALGALERRAHEAADFFASLDDTQWGHATVVLDLRWTADYAVRHICHDLLHHCQDIANIRADLGDAVTPLAGSVASLHASGGGVPKLAIDRAEVDAAGIVGDVQKSRVHHGRPWQALCLYSADVIADMAAQGHPIEPGSVGENISVAGVDWCALRAGMLVTVGGVRCRLSAPAEPCQKIKGSFFDADPRYLDHQVHPGQARWYATVLTPGMIEPGDEVTFATDGRS